MKMSGFSLGLGMRQAKQGTGAALNMLHRKSSQPYHQSMHCTVIH